MSLSHLTSQSLRRLLTLTEKKEQLLKGIEDVETEIAKALKGGASAVVEAAEVVTPFKPKKKAGKKSTKSGGLKDRILALLEAAGDQGLHVKEIAERLGSPKGNISVWFSTTGKKHATKLKPGHFAKKAAITATTPSNAAAPKKAAKKVVKRKRKKTAK